MWGVEQQVKIHENQFSSNGILSIIHTSPRPQANTHGLPLHVHACGASSVSDSASSMHVQVHMHPQVACLTSAVFTPF